MCFFVSIDILHDIFQLKRRRIENKWHLEKTLTLSMKSSLSEKLLDRMATKLDRGSSKETFLHFFNFSFSNFLFDFSLGGSIHFFCYCLR